MIYENGNLLAESERFSTHPQVIYADIDLDRLVQDRMRLTTFGQNARTHRERLDTFRQVPFSLGLPAGRILLDREYARFPYIPSDPAKRDQRCYEAYNIQVQGLAQRLKSSDIPHVVIGVSGGLDSTHALIVAARTMDLLKRPRANVKAFTMPGFATTDKTYRNARRLMDALGAEANEIDIRPSCMQMLKDLGHPYAAGEARYDITFENIQAGERTSHLFRIANMRQGLVVGTGDLSELALGWCTYGVGDHMSHYNVNASVPKTLIQHLIRWVAATQMFGAEASKTLESIAAGAISPELIPGETVQSTEAAIGPYELQDFNLYYITRYGLAPSKVLFLAWNAWREKYDYATLKHWLEVFIARFFANQYKRSAVPNGPKIVPGGALSPRGDWRMPSDASAAAWLAELKQNAPETLD